MEELKLLAERLRIKAEQIKNDKNSDTIDLAKALGLNQAVAETWSMINELKNKAI